MVLSLPAPTLTALAQATLGRATPAPTFQNDARSTQTIGNEPPIILPTATPATYTSYLPSISLFITLTPTHAQFDVPPPTPNWPDALAGLTHSKLGLHVIQNNDPYVMEFVRRVHPRVVKAVGDVGWLADVKAASSATVTVGRISEQTEDWALTVDPNEAADRYITSQLERYRANPAVDYWEGWNEYDPNDDAKLQWYAQFEAARACKMQALGLRAAVGGFATGVPEYNEMQMFLPALEAAHRCGGIFTLHEYNSPTLACGAGPTSQDRLPGAPDLPGVTVGYLSLRYRYWYEGLLKPRGLGDLPLVISELGIQGPARNCGDPGNLTGGWKTYADWWRQQGIGPGGAESYVNVLAWYDNQIRQDPYVIGATIFTAGAQDSANGWHTFDVHEVIIPLAYYVVGVPALPNVTVAYP